jgi:mono/diheme cytochrome c family protein
MYIRGSEFPGVFVSFFEFRPSNLRFEGFMKSIIAALLLIAACETAHAVPTFSHDIAPIVYENCVSCHRPGEVAPFSLINFDDVKKRAEQIASVTGDRYMPPWKPEPNFGHFKDERRLTDAQIKLISDWAAAEGWSLGPPDQIVKMSTPFKLGAEGRDQFRAFVLPLNNDDVKFVSAVEFRSDNRKIVHHALFFLDSNGAALAKEKLTTDGNPGYPAFGGPGFVPTGALGGWAPGAIPTLLPDGWGRMVKKNSDVVVQIHFHPDGKDETETFSMGIYYAKVPTTHIVAGGNAHNFRINIPAGDKDYVVKGHYKVPVDVDVIGITPHAHLICREMKASATTPDGKQIPLIWIKDWDFNWQGTYHYVDPIKLPAGTLVNFTYTYDNSTDNIHNPNNPPKPIHFGEQTTDEMAFLFLEGAPEKLTDFPALQKGNRSQMKDFLTRFFQ